MKVAIVAGLDASLVNFRGELLREIVAEGHEVIAISPSETPGLPDLLGEMGVRYVPVALNRAGLNPLADWRYGSDLKRCFRRERPDIVLAYTIKPIVFGIPSAVRAGVRSRFALITGLGTVFNTAGPKGFMLRAISSLLYSRALRSCDRIVVQNRDIAQYLVRYRIVRDDSRLCVVAGSGIDTERFTPSPVPAGPPVFLLLARMLHDKGVVEFVAAARLVKTRIPSARFLLVGDIDPNPSAISATQLQQWNREGVVEYRSAVKDVRGLLTACTVYVLPSYHEGLPRSVLEAMSTGRPVITTDVMGCRETVMGVGPEDEAGVRVGENGLLVPARSDQALAAAMIRLADDPDLCARMGTAGRRLAEDRFDVRRINREMLRVMGLSPCQRASESPSSAP